MDSCADGGGADRSPSVGVSDGAATSGTATQARTLLARRMGTVAYGDAVDLQAELVNKRRAGEITDQLLLLEHPHVITLGTSSRAENILIDEDVRRRLGVELYKTRRGGDVTYHGPGQLIGYPILDLKPDRRDLHRYVRDLEETLIRALADFGVTADRKEGMTGVWVGELKVAAIGVRVSRGWITSHGFALNVRTDLSFFDAIVPCGIRDFGVTSLDRVLHSSITVDEVSTRVAKRLSEVFERTLHEESMPTADRTRQAS